MKINVTKQDIARGQPHDPYDCPIAIAIKRVTHSLAVAVYMHDGNLDGQGFYLSKRAVRFIRHFDSAGYGQPFEFVLRRKAKKRQQQFPLDTHTHVCYTLAG